MAWFLGAVSVATLLANWGTIAYITYYETTPHYVRDLHVWYPWDRYPIPTITTIMVIGVVSGLAAAIKGSKGWLIIAAFNLGSFVLELGAG